MEKLTPIESAYIKDNRKDKTPEEIAAKLGKDVGTVTAAIAQLDTRPAKAAASADVFDPSKKIIPHAITMVDWILAGAAAFICLVLYLYTLTPSLPAGDSGELSTASYFLGIGHAPGYPLFTCLAKIFTYLPINNVAWRTNFFAMFMSVITVFVMYFILAKLLGQNRVSKGFNPRVHIPAFLGAIAFTLTYNLWSQSMQSEVYTLNIVQVAILTLIFIAWYEDVMNHRDTLTPYFGGRYLMAFAFQYGVAFGNHNIILPFGFAPIIFIGFILFTANMRFVRDMKSMAIPLVSVAIFMSALLIAGFGYLRFIMSFESNLFFAPMQNPQDIYTALASFPQVIFHPIANPGIISDIIATLGDKTYLYDGNKRGLLSDPNYPNLYKGIFIVFWPIFIALIWYCVFKFFLKKRVAGTEFDFISDITVQYYQMLFLFIIGALTYLYMPIRARGEPPLNWGQLNEASGWENFSYLFNMIHRKQYGRMGADISPWGNSPLLIVHPGQIKMLFNIFTMQLTWLAYVIAIPGLAMLYKRNKMFFSYTIFGFISFVIPLTIYINPPADSRTEFFFQVFFLPAVLYFVIWVAFGMQFIIEFAHKGIKRFIEPETSADIVQPEQETTLPWHARISLPQRIATGSIIAFLGIAGGINFNLNNNHNCWADSDYIQNIMMSLEPNAILATEGGDNQVFGLAYFTMVERRRPDIKVYDQKGNVFERIYGNLMKVYPTWLQNIQDTVDRQFIETGRPYYMLWQRPGLERLGDYYFKPYGIVFKVQPIRYYLVDKLAIVGTMSIAEYQKDASDILKRTYDGGKVARDIAMLVNEGCITDLGGAVQFRKLYKQPLSGLMNEEAYWDRYLGTGIGTNKALDRGSDNEKVNWDYLTREILINYISQRIELCERRIQELRFKIDRERGNAAAVTKYSEEIASQEKYRESLFEKGKVYGKGMVSAYFTFAVKYANRGRLPEAKKMYEEALAVDAGLYQAAMNLGSIYEQESLSAGAKEVEFLKKAKEYFQRAEKRLKRNAAGNQAALEQNMDYQRVRYAITKVNSCIEIPSAQLKEIRDQAEKNGDVNAYLRLIGIYLQRIDLGSAIWASQKALASGKLDQNMYGQVEMQLGNIYMNERRFDMAEAIFRRYLKDPGVNGAISKFMLARVSDMKQDIAGSYKWYSEFLTAAMPYQNDQTIRGLINFASQMKANIDQHMRRGGAGISAN